VRAFPRRELRIRIALALLVGGVVAVCAAVVFGPPFALAGVIAAAVELLVSTRRFRARKRLLAEPFPESFRRILRERVPYYSALSGGRKGRFEDDVRIFLAEQRIMNSEGGPVDEPTRVLIAASAAMLGNGMPDFEWPTLRDIVVYSRAFNADFSSGGRGELAGVVHARGPVVLSRRDLTHGFARPKDGHNVALHELAHVIDFEDQNADGVPGDLPFVATAPWVRAIADRLRKVQKRRYPKLLRAYAGTNEAEFFAVAVEAFFEKPKELEAKDPELYAMLASYFRQRP